MKKINFANDESFLYKPFLETMIAFCKKNLDLESVSIVTNDSFVDESFLKQYGKHIDILAVSCDFFNKQINIEIEKKNENQIKKLFQVAEWCKKFEIKFKFNTIVCRLNYTEDMNGIIEQLRSFRWKCFQIFFVVEKNDFDKILRDVRKFQIKNDQYRKFCFRHQHQSCFVSEFNNFMTKSYLILDEYMRFLNKNGRKPSSSILDVGVFTAFVQVYWDQNSFIERKEIYDWSKASVSTACTINDDKKLQWWHCRIGTRMIELLLTLSRLWEEDSMNQRLMNDTFVRSWRMKMLCCLRSEVISKFHIELEEGFDLWKTWLSFFSS